MIKRHTFLLTLLTAVFTAFTLGFFVGRNFNHTPVQLSGIHTTEASDENSRLILQSAATEASIATTAGQPETQSQTVASSSTVQTEPMTEPATEAPVIKETSPPVQSNTSKESTSPTTKATTPATTEATTAATATTAAQAETGKQTESTQPPTEPPETKETVPSNSGLININTASAAQLMTLPGIGEVLAQRIVEYREANGPFQSVAALTNVKGIGEKRLAAIIDLVTI